MTSRLCTAALAVLALVACTAEAPTTTTTGDLAVPLRANRTSDADGTLERQLERVRRATNRYHHIRRAIADGYTDINVVIPNMGQHYLRAALLDAAFDLERPELLVYTSGDHPRLVAVEYAVPLDLALTSPEGFSGEDDVWDRNTTFGLWTLHAWVWRHNPDGVFAPMNPRMP
jgi:hypothetical protein